MADKRISQLIERVTIANNDVLPIVASGATTTNKVTVSTLQDWMQNNLDVGVTSIGITIGSSGTDINVTGSPVTTSGNITINIPTASATNRGLLSSTDWTTFNNKLSSVGLSMPSAFTVSNSPLTANGTITVTGAGTVAQYIRGDGSLADFPEAGGGGASVSYYLNGSVSQGTIGGIAYREMNKTPILGAGTDFTIAADGYIASFITDAGDPSLLEIPGGNWNFESYFQASSGGGSPSFYIELYKVNSGGTATLIASNSANPELIAFGTTTTAYFSTLAVPTTTLALTDRLAVRFYVTHSGRTITMHTENSNLCQVITTFTTGLTALNGLTAQVQNFATGTSGTDFAISSAGSTHTFNLPDASASARGVVTTGSQVFGGVKTFANGLSLSAVGGSNQTTRIVNIGTLHEGTASVNQIGFNSGNNIYFGKGLNNGGVISWNNAAVRYYTLPDADGTIALTSQIPANPVGGTGTTNQIPKFSATSTLTNSNISDNGSDVVISSRTGISLSGQSILITPNLGGTTNRIETTGSLPLAIATSGSSITLAAGGTTPQITLASTGAATFTGSVGIGGTNTDSLFTINGTAGTSHQRFREGSTTVGFVGGANGIITGHNGKLAVRAESGLVLSGSGNSPDCIIASGGAATFTGDITASSNAFFGTFNGNDKYHFEPFTNAAGGANNAYFVSGKTDNNERSGFVFQARNSNGEEYNAVIVEGHNSTSTTTPLTISSTGAATFSSSVTATGGTEIPNGQFYRARRSSGSLLTDMIGIPSGTDDVRLLTTGDYNIVNGSLTNLMTIKNSGNVGIGTASPATTLHVLGGAAPVIFAGNSTTFYTTYRYNTSTDVGYIGNGQGVAIGGGQTDFGFQATGNMLFAAGGGSERMRITSGGNVFIGASTISSGRMELLVGGNSNGSVLSLGNNGNANKAQIISDSGENMLIVNRANTPMILYTNDTERMRITSGGDVLIGQTSVPGAFGNQKGLTLRQAGAILAVSDDDISGLFSRRNSNGDVVLFRRDTTTVGSISVTTTATSYNTSSDYRLKENVKPVENALSILIQLKPCTFNFITESEEEVMGFLAHEVQEVMPQAVKGEKDAVKIEQVEVSPAELDEEGNVITEAVIEEKEVPVYQGIDHSKLVPLLVASIQELKAEIEALKSQING